MGAGPDVTLTGGVGDLNARQLIELNSPFLYQPGLNANTANAAEGDIVRGAFTYTTFATENSATDPNAPYRRNDFQPLAAGSAFLVRLRRSNETDIPGGTSGTAIPLVFGLGSTIQPNPTGYSIRKDGITVRAAAIADARNALRLGAPVVNGVSFIEWTSAATTVNVIGIAPVTTVGEASIPQATASTGDQIVAIYDAIAGSSPATRVIGFGRANVTGSTGSRLPASLVPNGTRHLVGNVAALSETAWQQVLARNASLSASVLAPVLVR
jgi:hypothetical protein